MTDTEEMVILPGSGEVVALNAEPAEIAAAWEELQTLERDLRSVKRTISDEITRRLDFEGRRSLAIDGVKFETTAPTEREWDMPELQQLLRQLVGEGTISEKKADACIKWEPKVSWSEIKPLTTDPRCSARIAQTFKEVPAHRYAKVTRAS
jgi:hypothetical protein